MRIVRKNKRIKNSNPKKAQEKEIRCAKCKRVFKNLYSFNCHPCEDTRFRISDYLQKARIRFKEQSFISPQEACALLSCQPAQELCQEVGKKLQVPLRVIIYAVDMIKSFEKEKGMVIKSPPLPVKLASGAFYVGCLNNGVKLTQIEISKAFRCLPKRLKEGALLIKNCDFYEGVNF